MPLSLQAGVEVRAPAALVFEFISTPELLPQWNTSARSAFRLGDGPIGLGSRAVMQGKLLGQTLESETEVVGYEPPRLFATAGRRGPKLQTEFRLDSGPYGCHVAVQVSGEVPGGRLGNAMAQGVLRTELTQSLRRLADLCEAEARRRADAEPTQGGDPACWLHLEPDR